MKNILLFSAILLLVSCTKEKKPPHFSITNNTWVTTNSGLPALAITVINDGEMTGYNLEVDVQALQGSTIIEVAHAFPGDLSDIAPGVSAKDNAIFFSTSPQQLNSCTFKTSMTWLNRDY